MKKNGELRAAALLLSLILAFSLLPSPALAAEVKEVAVDGWNVSAIQVLDENGEWVWENVYDEYGKLVWVELVNDAGELEWFRVADLDPEELPARMEAAKEPQMQRKKAELEQAYGMSIDFSPVADYSADGKMLLLLQLSDAYAMMPEALVRRLTEVLRSQGHTLKLICGEPYSRNDSVGGVYSSKTYTITIYDYYNSRMLIHEYGHAIFQLLAARYGYDAIVQRMTELCGGVLYKNQGGEDDPEIGLGPFVTFYTSSSATEDFPETFSYMLSMPDFFWSIDNRRIDEAIEDPLYWKQVEYGSLVMQKAEYIRGMILEYFSLEDADLPSLHTSKPSPWAAEGVARYKDQFYHTLLEYGGTMGYPDYQGSIPRAAFAAGAYGVADMISRHREYIDIDEKVLSVLEPDYQWNTGSKLLKLYNPFTDTGRFDVFVLNRMGVINGRSDTIFDPDGGITREEAAAILYRLCAAMDYDFSGVSPVEPADAADCSPWALESIRMVCGAGIMNGVGDGVFAPKSPYTYEQSILTLLRVYDLLYS